MTGRIILGVCCLLCSVPFWIISLSDRRNPDPIPFWSGDDSLKEKVKDIAGYNLEMAKLYLKCAIVLSLTGVVAFVLPGVGMLLLILDLTVGGYLVYCTYQKIRKRYS